MVEVGRALAKSQSLTNIRWTLARAEEVHASPGSFELITIGEAFHRLDQRLIAQSAMAWLAPGRCLATLGCFSLMQGREPWHDILRTVVRRWADHGSTAQPAGMRPSPQPRGADHERQVLTAVGFEYVRRLRLPASLRLDAGFDPRESPLHFEALKAIAGRRGRALRRRPAARVACLRLQWPLPETLRFGYSLFRKPDGKPGSPDHMASSALSCHARHLPPLRLMYTCLPDAAD